MKETNKIYKENEMVESVRSMFILGCAKDKNGVAKVITKGDNPKAFVTLYIAGNEDDNTTTKFIDFVVSEKKYKELNENGVNLFEKSKTPVKVRYIINEYIGKDGQTKVLREIVNIAMKGVYGWVWVIESKTKKDAPVIKNNNKALPF